MEARYWTWLLVLPIFAVGAAVITAPLFPHDVPGSHITIERGSSLRSVLNRAADQGIIRTPKFSEWLARLTGYDQPKYGTYALPDYASDYQILQAWTRGNVATTSVTVLEGWTAVEIATAVELAGIAAGTEFLAATTSATVLDRYGILATEAEGYLFPETYRFAPGLPGTAIVDEMIRTFFARLPATYTTMARALDMNLQDAIILASIVQKETYILDEMPTVSGVFHNRLRRSMKLQADPTAIYRMPGYDGNLTRKHLTTPTPYNTYVITGLPAGPIGNPGLDALVAAVNPQQTTALYFVADHNGRHVFADTYQQHLDNVRRYQLTRRPAARTSTD